jgi:hypothetical protein
MSRTSHSVPGERRIRRVERGNLVRPYRSRHTVKHAKDARVKRSPERENVLCDLIVGRGVVVFVKGKRDTQMAGHRMCNSLVRIAIGSVLVRGAVGRRRYPACGAFGDHYGLVSASLPCGIAAKACVKGAQVKIQKEHRLPPGRRRALRPCRSSCRGSCRNVGRNVGRSVGRSVGRIWRSCRHGDEEHRDHRAAMHSHLLEYKRYALKSCAELIASPYFPSICLFVY